MVQQLILIEERPVDWRIDARTRAVGRQGLLAARAALASTPPPIAA